MIKKIKLRNWMASQKAGQPGIILSQPGRHPASGPYRQPTVSIYTFPKAEELESLQYSAIQDHVKAYII